MKCQGTGPAKRTHGRPRCDKTLHLTHCIEPQASIHTLIGQEVPIGHQIPCSCEKVCQSQQSDDFLSHVSDTLQSKVSYEYQQGAEDGEGTRHDGAVCWVVSNDQCAITGTVADGR